MRASGEAGGKAEFNARTRDEVPAWTISFVKRSQLCKSLWQLPEG